MRLQFRLLRSLFRDYTIVYVDAYPSLRLHTSPQLAKHLDGVKCRRRTLTTVENLTTLAAMTQLASP